MTRRLATIDDIRIALASFDQAISTPRPRCIEGARKHQARIDRAKAKLIKLIEIVADYDTIPCD